MQPFIVKANGSKYKVVSDDALVLFAALLLHFDDGPIVICPDIEEEFLDDEDQVVLYAPDQISKDNTINCNFEKFCKEHADEIKTVIEGIEKI